MDKKLATDSWFEGLCKNCHSNVVVCQSSTKDYFYYCSQKRCKNHDGVEIYYYEDVPDFILF